MFKLKGRVPPNPWPKHIKFQRSRSYFKMAGEHPEYIFGCSVWGRGCNFYSKLPSLGQGQAYTALFTQCESQKTTKAGSHQTTSTTDTTKKGKGEPGMEGFKLLAAKGNRASQEEVVQLGLRPTAAHLQLQKDRTGLT